MLSRESTNAPTMQNALNISNNNQVKGSQTWYVDSSASNHMTGHKEWFEWLEKYWKTRSCKNGLTTWHTLLSTSSETQYSSSGIEVHGERTSSCAEYCQELGLCGPNVRLGHEGDVQWEWMLYRNMTSQCEHGFILWSWRAKYLNTSSNFKSLVEKQPGK